MKSHTLPLQKLVIRQKGEKPKQLSRVSTPDTLPYLGIEAVEKGEIKQYADQYSTVHSTEQDIFVVADGARNGLILKGKKGAVGSTLYCITPLWIDTDYLFYFLKLNEIQRKDTRHVENTFWDTPVPIVSLEKQKQIANNIKEALSVFEQQNKESEFKLIKSLKSLVKTNSDVLESIQSLDSLKKAVLDLAISGELISGSQINNSKNVDHISTDLENIADITMLAGTEYSQYFNPKSEGDIPIIRAQNIGDGVFIEQNLLYLSERISDSLLRSQIKGGELLMVNIGANTGNACIAPKRKAHLGKNVAKISVKDSNISVNYLNYFFQSSIGKQNINFYRQETSIPNISVSDIRHINIVYPPLDTQLKIVNIISIIFQEAEIINQDYKNEELKQEELQKSILSSFYEDLTFDGDIKDILPKIELARSKKDLEITDLRKKQKQFRDKLSAQPKMEIIDILKSSGNPMFINDLWVKSKYNGNIDAFYEALKQEFEGNSIKWELVDESSEAPQSRISLNQLPA